MTSVEFTLHDAVRIRLVDPPRAAVEAVTADLGLQPTAVVGDSADITAAFTDDLTLPEPLRRVGRDAGFAGDTFVLGRGAGHRVAFDVDVVGGRAALRCERQVVHLPHLVTLVNLAMLAHGTVALHGSALEQRGRGVVATGWSKGGKTELVLGLMARGATFVADEWCYLGRSGDVLGLRHPVRVWDWQLRQLPELARTLTGRQRARLAGTRPLARVRQLGSVLHPTLGVSSPPERLFGLDRLAERCRLDLLVLVEAHDDPAIGVRELDPAEVAARMTASLMTERNDLMLDLLRRQFALPDRPVPDWEAVTRKERALLTEAFGSTRAWLVSHPYPVDLAALADAVEGLG